MTYEPTEAEIEVLALEIRKSFLPNDIIDSRTNARWILSRFVRREEAAAHVTARDGRINELRKQRDMEQATSDRLRAELRGQRCDGSGRLDLHSYGYIFCPGCTACKPDATPQGDGGRWAKAIAAADPGRADTDDRSRASDGVSEAEEQAAPPVATSGYQSATPVPVSANDFSGWNHGSTEYESRTLQNQCLIGQLLIEQRDSNPPVPIEHLVKLHPETLRALVAALLSDRARRDVAGVDWAEALLAKLEETK